MESVNILQKIGVDPCLVEELISGAGLDLQIVWEDWRDVVSPDEISVIVTVNTPVDLAVMGRFPNLRMIAVAFTGHDHVDKEACKERGIKVYNVPSYSTDSVAELAIATAISLLRDIPRGDRDIREVADGRADWWTGFGPGTELAGQTVGILGTGTIGLRVTELFRAFKCEIIGWSREKRDAFCKAGGTYVSKEEVFSEADIVSVHIALNDQTRGFVGKERLNMMKPGACLINTARGPVIETEALVEALKANRIRAALDVFDLEPLPAGDPLLALPNTVLTPHVAYKTKEALERRAQITIENIGRFLGGDDTNRVA